NDIPYKIDRNDLAYKLFKKAGATWGGDWKTMKDYQHFQFPM
ncbi:MAG: M15 family metallopeptidase, partial [Porphyromonadaceae bacterium]